MKSFAVLVIVLVSGFCLADEKTNKYMDNFLGSAFASEVRSIDIGKVAAPDFEVKFEEKMKVFGKVKGKAQFHDGRVEGLDGAKRQSDCQTGTEGSGFKVSKTVSCTIEFKKLKVKYDGKLKFGKLPKTNIKGEAKISETRFFLKIVGGKLPVLSNFTCVQKGSTPKIELTGLGPLNRFLKALEDGFKKHIQTTLFDTMTEKLEYAINRALSKDSSQFELGG